MTQPLNTAPLSCPGCIRQGSLTLLQEGRTSLIPGLKDRPALYGCLKCGWEGWETRLQEPSGVSLDGIRVDIQAAWDEQEHMDIPSGGGGGAKGRRQPKPGDKELVKRPEQEPTPPTREGIREAITSEARESILYKLPAYQKTVMRRAARERGLTLTAIIDQALALWFEREFILVAPPVSVKVEPLEVTLSLRYPDGTTTQRTSSAAPPGGQLSPRD